MKTDKKSRVLTEKRVRLGFKTKQWKILKSTAPSVAVMAKRRVSVVIPAYNEAVTIGEVIGNYKVFCDEIIVVDDGSTDDTAKIAQKE